MSKPITFLWPAPDVQAVCLGQNIAAPGALLINGTLSNPDKNFGMFATFKNIARTVSLTSAGNLAGVVFTITGFVGNGSTPVTTVINGPNAGTVYTTQLYTTVTSITASAGFFPGVQIGSGLTGYTFWYRSDYSRTVADMTIAVSVTGVIIYTFETTLDDPEVVASPVIWMPIDGVTVPTVPAGTPMNAASVDIISNYTFPAYASRITIDGSNLGSTLEAQFLQQGIK